MKSFEIKTKIHFGDNALERLAQMPYNRVLVITDPFIAKGPMIRMITDPLDRAGKTYEVFHDVVPDAPIDKIIIGERENRHSKKNVKQKIRILFKGFGELDDLMCV